MHPDISRKEEKLDALFRQVDSMQDRDDRDKDDQDQEELDQDSDERDQDDLDKIYIDDALKAQFVWYLCVRTAGYVETSVKTVVIEHVESMTSHQPIIRFVEDRIRNTPAIKCSDILRLVRPFSEAWWNSLKTSFDDEDDELANSLGNLRTNRNDIAHGRDVDLTLQVLRVYFEHAKKVVKLVYESCPTQVSIATK